MSIMTQIALAYVIGLVIGGVAAALLELVSGDEPSFAPPFFSVEHPLRFTLALLAAGPFMLANDALRARRNHTLTRGRLTWAFVTASIWALAIGTVSIGAAMQALHA